MFGKVIVGIGEAPHGLDAIALARALAPRGELHLVHAYPHDPAGWVAVEEWRGGLRGEAERLLADVAGDAGLEVDRRAVADRSPARALHMVAEELGADVIVVGSARHGAVGRLVAGSVARSTLSGAPCPVAVAPRDCEGAQPASVGVAFDGSPESGEALTLAADLARAHRARLRVINVIGLPRELVAPMYPLAYAPHEWQRHEELSVSRAHAVVERAVTSLAGGVDVEGEVVFGHARKELTDLSEHLDLLVLGSRGWGPVRRVLLGSTSNHLVDRAACPVVVVPRTAATHERPSGDAVESASA